MSEALQHEATKVLQRLVRMNMVNPPGNERPAQEFLGATGSGRCSAYGFFPHRHMPLELPDQLVHGREERIDVRDLGLAVDCYRAVVTELLGED